MKNPLDPDFKKKIDDVLKELKSSLHDLYDAATKDEKTGAYNHRFFKNIFLMELEKAKRGKQKICLVVIDIDFFKKLNDSHGHLVGDEILKELVVILTKTLRKYDVLSRFGGEEFFVLLPQTSIIQGKRISERLRKSLTSGKLMKKYNVTISVGITEYKEKDNFERMVKRADKALYLSKKGGRNRVSVG